MCLTPRPRRFAAAFLVCALASLTLLVATNEQAIAPAALCAREFATIGGGAQYDKLRIDPAGAENQGNEIARFWASNNSGQANNFDGSCPGQSAEQAGGGWWELSQDPLRGIRGLIGEPGCVTNGCPEGPLTVLVEDLGEDDWLATSQFIALQVDPTPEGLRWWDLSRVDPADSPSVLAMQPFPEVVITSANRVGYEILANIRFPEVVPGVHAVSDPGSDTPLPTSAVVQSFDLYRHVGNSSPSRFATDWTLVEQIPYQEGTPAETSIAIDCRWEFTEDEYYAIGLTFHGGDGPAVRSMLLGQPFLAECYDGRIGSAASGLIEYGTSPCTGTEDALISTNPCLGWSSAISSYVFDLDQHLCEMVTVSGYQYWAWPPPYQCNTVDVYAIEPAVPDCLVQVRELTVAPVPEGLRLEWMPLPCSEDYDVIRGDLDQLTEGGLGAVLCIDNDTELLETLDSTGQNPEPGDGYFYLTRSRGTVGSVNYGYTSEETPRMPSLGDCPLD